MSIYKPCDIRGHYCTELTPDLYRIGASTLLNDVLMQIEFQRTGRYQDPDDFTLD